MFNCHALSPPTAANKIQQILNICLPLRVETSPMTVGHGVSDRSKANPTIVGHIGLDSIHSKKELNRQLNIHLGELKEI